MYIKCKNIYCENKIIDGFIEYKDGKIKDILGSGEIVTEYEDFSECIIIPGIIDTHNHGCNGYNLMEEKVDDDYIHGYLKSLTEFGVTGVLPTLVETFDQLENYCNYENRSDECELLGINMEGSYLHLNSSHDKKLKNSDITYVKHLIDIGKNRIKVMSIAPDMDKSNEIIDYLIEHKIIVSMGHSKMDEQQCKKAITQGCSLATHIGNGMQGIHQRDIGTLGVCMLDDELMVEMICDGKHICYDMAKLIMKVKPKSKIIIISDGNCYTGLTAGVYPGMLNKDDLMYVTEEGEAKDKDGNMMGSSIPIIKAIRNFQSKNIASLRDMIQMACYNPAKFYGFLDRKGSIVKGKDADFVVLDLNLEVVRTYCRGNLVYSKY